MLKLFHGTAVRAALRKRYPLNFFSSTQKDYYAVLGVPRGATEDEIKEAYRNLAKKYHPDVNTTGVYHEPDGEKFKEIAEAYAVLSVAESKLSYDFLNQNTPESLYREQRNENYRKMTERGPDGQLFKERFKKGTYAEQKFEVLKEERKRFNVDIFGRYKGGVPNKGKGRKRGNSLGVPGTFHEPLTHNFNVNPHPDSQFVTDRDALAFKLYQNEDKYVIQNRWLWFKAEVDYEFFKFKTYRTGWRWFRNLFILFGLALVYNSHQMNTNQRIKRMISRKIKKDDGLTKKEYQVFDWKVALTENGVLKHK